MIDFYLFIYLSPFVRYVLQYDIKLGSNSIELHKLWRIIYITNGLIERLMEYHLHCID